MIKEINTGLSERIIINCDIDKYWYDKDAGYHCLQFFRDTIAALSSYLILHMIKEWQLLSILETNQNMSSYKHFTCNYYNNTLTIIT